MSYHVFLSFRGEDTRKTFTSHLYNALSGAGFRTFLDDDGIERGENVKSELEKAIKEARSSIIVLSKDYSSSSWCLDELVIILERTRTSSGAGHVILPVFYDVDPSHVRMQTESFGVAFCKHEERLKAEMDENKKENLREKVQVWRRALTEVADLAGMVLQNQADGHEAKFIKDIVREIGKKLNRPVLHVADNPVGIQSRVRNIMSWLQDESDVGIAVIYGMGGIGKTTLAKFAYNENINRFEASSFLANITEISKGPKGLVRLQRQFLLDIFKREKEEIRSVDEGISKIKEFIRCKRVLVVLDDVDNRTQFDALIGMRDWFRPGSKIILTTRNIHLLKPDEVDVTFKVVGLDFYESLELFSWHAFGQDHPIEDYTELSQRVVQHCGGLPLALQVLGCSLSNHQSLDIWEDTIQKLAAIPDSEILKILQISYDCLDDYCKELFLHIACFFIGKGKNLVERILDYLYPTVGIQTLIDRCLLTIDGQNKLMMHQLIQQMGREIVRQESPKEPGKRSRLWHYKDSFKVLSEKIGTEKVEGVYLDMHHVMEEDSRLRKNFMELKTDAFKRMPNLKFLQLNNVEIKGRFADFPPELRCLIWQHGFSSTSITGQMFLASLKILNLSHSHGLKNTPKFTGLPNLEKLVLKYCLSLVEVHDSIGELGSLVLLNLKGCKNLKTLPCKIGHLTSLEKLILSGCSKLDRLPTELEQMKSLMVLRADGISQDNGKDGSWTSLAWSLVLKPRKSPKPLPSLPGSLVKLSLSKCNLSSDDLGKCLGSFSVLKELDLSENPISSLPESFKGLTMLQKLVLYGCSRLQLLPELPMTIEKLNLVDCISLERITNLPNLLTSLRYDMDSCRVVEGQWMFKLESHGNADAEIINKMGISLSELETLGSLEVPLRCMLWGNLPRMKCAPQVLQEFGIYSIYLPRSEVPAGWCSTEKRMGTTITFNVPSVPNLKIQALKIYVKGKADHSFRMNEGNVPITLTNTTKGLLWAYHPLFVVIPEDDGMMVWLIHWNVGDQIILEAGDEMNVLAPRYWGPDDLGMEVGVQIVYEESEESSQNSKAYSPRQNVTIVEDLSAYQIKPGIYHLCHYSGHDNPGHKNCWCTFFEPVEANVHRDEKCYRLSHFFEQRVNEGKTCFRPRCGLLVTDEEDETDEESQGGV